MSIVTDWILPEGERRPLVEGAAYPHGLRPELVMGICEVESSWRPYAMRHEPNWRYWMEWVDNHRTVSSDTERRQQAISWGLMQVMGTVARERGCDAPFLSVLLDPATGLWWGCRHLAFLLKRHGGVEMDAISAYNAGTPWRDKQGNYINDGYVRRVLQAIDRQAT